MLEVDKFYLVNSVSEFELLGGCRLSSARVTRVCGALSASRDVCACMYRANFGDF